MSVYNFKYSMEISLTAPCSDHSFLLKCYPQENRRQRILRFSEEIYPAAALQYSSDWAGNQQCIGTITQSHTSFSVTVQGAAETYADFYEEYDPSVSPFYKYATELTEAGDFIKSIAAETPENADFYEKSVLLLHAAHNALRYEKGVTTVRTTAEEAARAGKGVCQDFVNVFLALCRYYRIPCRYCAGLVNGIGESHAWAEVNCSGYWYAFDPAADKLVGDGYLKFSHGRDYTDCTINRGSFRGAAKQTQNIFASMIPEEE